MTQVIAQTIRKVVYCIADHEDPTIGKLLVGLSRMARQTSFVGTDKQLTLSAVKDIYVYLQSGEKNEGERQISTAHRAQYQLSNKKTGQTRAQDPLQFSLFGAQNAVEVKQSRAQKSKRRLNPYEQISEQPQLIQNVYQLSADADLIYAEALVQSNKTQIILSVLFVNRTNAVIESLELELFTSTALKTHQAKHALTLEPHGQVIEQYELSVSSCGSATIYGNICARFQQNARERHKDIVMRTKEIQFDVSQFIKPLKLSLSEFRRQWAAVQTQEFRTQACVKTLPDFQQVAERLNLQQIMADEEAGVAEALFAAQSAIGDVVFVVFGVCSGETSMVKVRSSNQDLALGVGHEINRGI